MDRPQVDLCPRHSEPLSSLPPHQHIFNSLQNGAEKKKIFFLIPQCFLEIFACEHIEIGLNFLATATQYSTVLIGTFSFQLLFPKGPLFVSIKI